MISQKAKNMSSRQHVQYSQTVGADGQRRYYNSCRAANLKVQKTSRQSDINHVDFVVEGGTVDVKGIKETHKLGQILLEIKNVQGKDGWCSDNGPDFISFDFGLFFLNVRNSDLVKLVKKKCDLTKKVSKALDALYKGYTRSGRSDLMTIVSLSDVIKTCEHWYLPVRDWHEEMTKL